MKMPYLQKYDIIDTGWRIKPWFKIDLARLQTWYSELERDYGSWKFEYSKHIDMWARPPGDPSGVEGHLFQPDTSWYTLCHNSDIRGPIPPERSMSKPEYQDHDENLLYPRECFGGYGLEVIKSMPCRVKRVVVSITTPGTKLVMHQDTPTKLRFHITLKTTPDFYWIIAGEKIDIPADGWVYLVNTSLPHMIENLGTEPRISMYGKVWTEDVLKLL